MSSSGEVKQSRKNTDSIYHAGYDEDLKPIPMEKYFHPKRENKYKENPLKDDNNEYVPHKTGPRSRVSINNTPPFNVRKLYPENWTDEGHTVYDSKYPNGVDEKRKEKWEKKEIDRRAKIKNTILQDLGLDKINFNNINMLTYNNIISKLKNNSNYYFDSYILNDFKEFYSDNFYDGYEYYDTIEKYIPGIIKNTFNRIESYFHENINDMVYEIDGYIENDKSEFNEIFNPQWISAVSDGNLWGNKYAKHETFQNYGPWKYRDNNEEGFNLELISNEYKKENKVYHAKVKVTDTQGVNAILENKKCKNSLFRGGNWTVKMLPNTQEE